MAEQETVSALVREAMRVLHHDATWTDKEARWEIAQLTEAFTKILKGRKHGRKATVRRKSV